MLSTDAASTIAAPNQQNWRDDYTAVPGSFILNMRGQDKPAIRSPSGKDDVKGRTMSERHNKIIDEVYRPALSTTYKDINESFDDQMNAFLLDLDSKINFDPDRSRFENFLDSSIDFLTKLWQPFFQDIEERLDGYTSSVKQSSKALGFVDKDGLRWNEEFLNNIKTGGFETFTGITKGIFAVSAMLLSAMEGRVDADRLNTIYQNSYKLMANLIQVNIFDTSVIQKIFERFGEEGAKDNKGMIALGGEENNTLLFKKEALRKFFKELPFFRRKWPILVAASRGAAWSHFFGRKPFGCPAFFTRIKVNEQGKEMNLIEIMHEQMTRFFNRLLDHELIKDTLN